MNATRRGFLRWLGALGAAALGGAAAGDDSKPGGPGAPAGPPGLPVRPLGKTGAKVTLIGLGGWHIGRPGEAAGVALVQEAVDAGITFLDNAADYHGGASEERMGKALAAGGRRDRVFLMTKCCDHARTRQGSLRDLEESLRRLRTDRLDLWQLHDVTRADEPARIHAKGGAVEAVEEAKRRGLVRFAGFTGHRDPRLFLEMLEHGYPWDTAQMPLSPADPHWRSFERQVLPALVERGIGVIGMKALASGALPRSGAATAEECIRYSLSLPTATVVCGMDSRDALQQDLGVARAFTPMSGEERAALVAKVAAAARDGRLEDYKHP